MSATGVLLTISVTVFARWPAASFMFVLWLPSQEEHALSRKQHNLISFDPAQPSGAVRNPQPSLLCVGHTQLRSIARGICYLRFVERTKPHRRLLGHDDGCPLAR